MVPEIRLVYQTNLESSYKNMNKNTNPGTTYDFIYSMINKDKYLLLVLIVGYIIFQIGIKVILSIHVAIQQNYITYLFSLIIYYTLFRYYITPIRDGDSFKTIEISFITVNCIA